MGVAPRGYRRRPVARGNGSSRPRRRPASHGTPVGGTRVTRVGRRTGATVRTLGVVLLDPETENDIASELCKLVGRAILPVGRLDRPGDTARGFGTAFFFTELVAAADGGQLVREYLLTADAITRAPFGEFGLRPSVTEPGGGARTRSCWRTSPTQWAALSGGRVRRHARQRACTSTPRARAGGGGRSR